MVLGGSQRSTIIKGELVEGSGVTRMTFDYNDLGVASLAILLRENEVTLFDILNGDRNLVIHRDVLSSNLEVGHLMFLGIHKFGQHLSPGEA